MEAGFDTTITRAYRRDRDLFRTRAKTHQIYEERYIPGQKLYLSTQRPFDKADVIVDNNDFDNPVLKIR